MEKQGVTLTQQDLEDWITNMATGEFHYTKVMDGRVPKELWTKLRVMMHRCREKGIAVPESKRGDGWWRPVDHALEEICWWDGDGTIEENLLLPLGINKLCYIPRPSLILIAGKYNAGKTAFCINVVHRNLELWKDKLDFYVSEGAEMIKSKFDILEPFMPKPPPFKMYRRTENFADIINPDHLSVVDYLRVDMTQPYAVGQKLFELFNVLVGHDGIIVVAMQKPPGDRKLAFGGAATAFEPTLYMGMETVSKDTGWLGFEKIKVGKMTDFDPYHLRIHYKVENGAKFYDVHEVLGEQGG